MKRLLISIVLLAGFAAGAMAQYDWKERRNTISVTVGSPSLVAGLTGIFSTGATNASNKEMESKIYGTYGIHYGFNVLKWMRVGGSFFYSGWKIDQQKNEQTLTDKYDEMVLLAKVDFTYLNRKYVRLYSGAGVGADLTTLKKYANGASKNEGADDEFTPYCAWTVTPIGVEAGGKCVFGIAEINIGHADMFRVGLGFRF